MNQEETMIPLAKFIPTTSNKNTFLSLYFTKKPRNESNKSPSYKSK